MSRPSRIFAFAVLATCGWLAFSLVPPGSAAEEPVTVKPSRAERLKRAAAKLAPLQKTISEPRSGDWLDRHDEAGQTFDEYLEMFPDPPGKSLAVIYIQPIGEFSAEQKKVVQETARFLAAFFNRRCAFLKPVPLSAIDEKAKRKHPSWGMDQLLTTYLVDEILVKRKPRDADMVIGLTAVDLWPGRGWNFVFGQAHINKRVGVWSLYRNGDPAESEEEYRLCLLRTIKTAAHEAGHLYGIMHCTAYECGMCGSNHREESDRRPLWFCRECMPKVCWATASEPAERSRKLAVICDVIDLPDEANYYRKVDKILAEE